MIDHFLRQVRVAFGGGIASQLERIARELGFPSHTVGPDAGGVSVPFGDDRYTVVVEGRPDGGVFLTAHSNISFARGHLPPEVGDVLAKRNRQLPHCDWKIFEDRGAANYAVITRVRPGAFDADTFRAALCEVIPEVAALDQTLTQMGYAR